MSLYANSEESYLFLSFMFALCDNSAGNFFLPYFSFFFGGGGGGGGGGGWMNKSFH
jgi:hypothetical protein